MIGYPNESKRRLLVSIKVNVGGFEIVVLLRSDDFVRFFFFRFFFFFFFFDFTVGISDIDFTGGSIVTVFFGVEAILRKCSRTLVQF